MPSYPASYTKRFSKATLDKVYKRGLGAYYSSGSRPKVSAQQWAMGRVKSFVSGKGGARKADADLLGKGKKKTKKTQEFDMAKKTVDAPKGFHWMQNGKSFKLMKDPTGGYKPHKGSSKKASFDIQTVHKGK